MPRRPVVIASALSLLLCVAAVAMWARSYSRWEWIGYQATSGRFYSLTSRLGAVVFDITDGWPKGTYPELMCRSDPVLVQSLPAPSLGSVLGCGVDRATLNIGVAANGWSGSATSRAVVVHYWVFSAVLGVVLLRMARSLFRRRPLPGMCRKCGYDLRASPGRCPECGTEPI